MPATKRKIKTGKRPIRQAIIKNKKWIICTTAALVLTSIFAYTCFSLAKEMQGARGYVSDECWYASSARNILRELFNTQPSYVDSEGKYHYTIFFYGWNDRASSLKVSGSVTLYEHVKYEGKSITFTENVSSLVDYEWNDRVSSLKVSGSVTLYEDENYGGASITFTNNISSLVPEYEGKENFTNFVKSELGGGITYTYTKVAAISIATPQKVDYKNLLETFPKIEFIQSGYDYPDTDGIGNFLNTEHPPLAKYIIGVSMLTLGDEPINWRIPGIIAGSITILLVYLIVEKLTNNGLISLFVFLFAFTDPILNAMSSIAMLDIYAAFFMTLSMWLALRKNYLLSAISIGLATSCKLNGLFVAPALFLFMIQSKKPRFSGALKRKLVQFVRWLADPRPYFYAFVIPLFILFVFDIPFVVRFGPGWLAYNFPGNIPWFLTPQGGSTPWGWFVNQNVFWLNFNPDVSASVNSFIYFMALIALIFVPHLARRVNKEYLVPGLWFSTTFLGFAFMYILGRTGQYSFYAVALSPSVYVLACVLVYYFIENATLHIKFMASILRNPKPVIAKIRRNPKLIPQKFAKIHKSADPFMVGPRRAPEIRRRKRPTKRHPTK